MQAPEAVCQATCKQEHGRICIASTYEGPSSHRTFWWNQTGWLAARSTDLQDTTRHEYGSSIRAGCYHKRRLDDHLVCGCCKTKPCDRDLTLRNDRLSYCLTQHYKSTSQHVQLCTWTLRNEPSQLAQGTQRLRNAHAGRPEQRGQRDTPLCKAPLDLVLAERSSLTCSSHMWHSCWLSEVSPVHHLCQASMTAEARGL